MMILLWEADKPMFLQYSNDKEKNNVNIVKTSPITPESIAMKCRHKADLEAIKKLYDDIDLEKKAQNIAKNMNKFEKFISTPEFIFYSNQKYDKLYYEQKKYNIDFILDKSEFKKYLSKEKFINSELEIKKINALNLDSNIKIN